MNEITPILTTSQLKGFGFAISAITYLESIQSASETKEKEVLGFISEIPKYEIDDNVLIAAGQLRTLYAQEKQIAENSISIPDAIIGATATITNSLIITADFNGFPRPFFFEKYKKLISYDYKNKRKMACIYLLEPDVRIINFRFSERPK